MKQHHIVSSEWICWLLSDLYELRNILCSSQVFMHLMDVPVLHFSFMARITATLILCLRCAVPWVVHSHRMQGSDCYGVHCCSSSFSFMIMKALSGWMTVSELHLVQTCTSIRSYLGPCPWRWCSWLLLTWDFCHGQKGTEQEQPCNCLHLCSMTCCLYFHLFISLLIR